MTQLRQVKALNLYKDFPEKISTSEFKDIYEKGYMIFENQLSKENCRELINFSIKNYKNTIKKYDLETLKRIAELGCIRSPFVSNNYFRDLLLDPLMHEICNDFFPCGYILHLARSILQEPSISKESSPTEVHRDLPYLYTPTEFPLSLSFLHFFNSSASPQLLLIENSNRNNFYNPIEKIIEISPKEGTLLAFDSNILHCSLPTDELVSYCLHMFSSPLLKQVVDYSSKSVIGNIEKYDYRIDEVMQILGNRFLSPKDDEELIKRKISRIKTNENYYKTDSFGNTK